MQEPVGTGYADFEAKVLEEFDQLKNLSTLYRMQRDREIERQFDGRLSGCLFIPFLRIANLFGTRVVRKEIDRINYAKYYKQADQLLAEPLVRQAICSAFVDRSKDQIITEDVFVRLCASALYEEDLRNKFDIPLEPVFFAVVEYKILIKGIQAYCDEV